MSASPRTALHPDLAWARSGAMALTGHAAGPPRLAPGGIARYAARVWERLRALEPSLPADLDAPALLGERAARLGLARAGTRSPGGSCRLLRACDGWLAVSLSRPDDVELLPAWLEQDGEPGDGWAFTAGLVADRTVATLVERARWMGLPVAAAGPPRDGGDEVRVLSRGPTAPRAPITPRVIDLSSLWAGPLCTHLLGLAGANVVKVECRRRPDGARSGDPGFFDLLHAGKRSLALDFTSSGDRTRLARLVRSADVVVESARPRALRQLGIDAERVVAERPGTTWVSITGYGRDDPGVAFGDDAGAAAGLAHATGDEGGPIFCGDAIADPLTGLRAAEAALTAHRRGGGVLLDVPLRSVAAAALAEPVPGERAALEPDGSGWAVRVGREREPVAAPRSRPAGERARPLGADTGEVLAELGAC